MRVEYEAVLADLRRKADVINSAIQSIEAALCELPNANTVSRKQRHEIPDETLGGRFHAFAPERAAAYAKACAESEQKAEGGGIGVKY